MYETQCIAYVTIEAEIYGISTSQASSGNASWRNMAASLRILAKGKLSTMQPALKAIITRTCSVLLSRGLSVTSECGRNLFIVCLV